MKGKVKITSSGYDPDKPTHDLTLGKPSGTIPAQSSEAEEPEPV